MNDETRCAVCGLPEHELIHMGRVEAGSTAHAFIPGYEEGHDAMNHDDCKRCGTSWSNAR